MLDVEYLLNFSGDLSRSIIYRYKSGVLLSAFNRLLKEVAERENNLLLGLGPYELNARAASGGLFASMAFCDISNSSEWTGYSPEDAIRYLTSCIGEGLPPVVVFVREGSSFVKHANWPRLEASCLVIEEASVTRDTLAVVLAYFSKECPFANAASLIEQPGVTAYFETLLADQASEDLREFKKEFDRAILLNVDPSSGVFSAKSAATDQDRRRNQIMRPLRQLVEKQDASALPDFLSGLANKFSSGRAAAAITDELLWQTQNLFEHSRLCYETLIWSAVLLASLTSARLQLKTSSTNAMDSSLVIVDQLARSFLQRTARDFSDPLAELWSDLHEAVRLSRDDVQDGLQAYRLVHRIAEHLEHHQEANDDIWITQLRWLLTERASESSEQNEHAGTDQRVTAPAKEPSSFNDIIGHKHAVEGLLRRIRLREHSIPLILHGPDGVGKRTLAGLYAKSLLCEGIPDSTKTFCGRCCACQDFAANRLFGLIEFDAGMVSAPAYIRENLLPNLRYVGFSSHRVVIIANPDKNPRVVDICLKTLESHAETTTFIFTLNDLHGMREAGQSRSELFRLSPLGTEESRQLGERFLAATVSPCKHSILDLIVEGADGLPGRLKEQAASVLSAGAMTLEDARSALRLNWPRDAIDCWQTLLSKSDVEFETIQGGPYPDRKVTVEQMRSVLNELRYTLITGKNSQAAFLHSDLNPTLRLADLLIKHSADRGVSVDKFWSELSQSWASSDSDDDLKFRQTYTSRCF